MFGRRPRLADEQAAEILENLHGTSTRAGHQLRAAALALAPDTSTTQRESHRRKVKAVMLREFDRGDNLPVRERRTDLDLELPGHAPTGMLVDGQRLRIADIDEVNDATAALAAEVLLRHAALVNAERKA